MLSEADTLIALRMTFADQDGWVNRATLNELERQQLVSRYEIELTDEGRPPLKLTRYRLTETGRAMLPEQQVAQEEEAQVQYLF